MTFTFLQASYGDSILISFHDNEGKLVNVLVDGGPKEAYEYETADGWDDGDLKKTVQDIRGKQQYIDLLILTHVDHDHVGGILDWFGKDPNAHQLIKKVWFNGGDLIAEYSQTDPVQIESLTFTTFTDTDTSIKEGIDFQKYIAKHGIWEYSIIESSQQRELFGAIFHILSPHRDAILALGKKWEKQPVYDDTSTSPKETDHQFALHELLRDDIFEQDRSLHNRSSIAFLLTYRSENYLFCADAFPGIMVDALKAKGYHAGNRLSCKLVKLSHHGSSRNTNREFLEVLDCKQFVVSTNGSRHGLPDKRTLSRIASLHPEATVYFNYPELLEEFTHDADKIYFPNFQIRSMDQNQIPAVTAMKPPKMADSLQIYTPKVASASGCIIQSASNDCTYILTAKHVVEKLTQLKIAFQVWTEKGWQDDEIDYDKKVGDNYFEHDVYDIAILKIGYRTLPVDPLLISEEHDVKQKCSLCGYPEIRKNNKTVKYKMTPDVQVLNTISAGLIEVNIPGGQSHEKLRGFSGGGLFYEVQDSYYLAGIKCRVIEPNQKNGEAAVCPISAFNDIVQNYPKKLQGFPASVVPGTSANKFADQPGQQPPSRFKPAQRITATRIRRRWIYVAVFLIVGAIVAALIFNQNRGRDGNEPDYFKEMQPQAYFFIENDSAGYSVEEMIEGEIAPGKESPADLLLALSNLQTTSLKEADLRRMFSITNNTSATESLISFNFINGVKPVVSEKGALFFAFKLGGKYDALVRDNIFNNKNHWRKINIPMGDIILFRHPVKDSSVTYNFDSTIE